MSAPMGTRMSAAAALLTLYFPPAAAAPPTSAAAPSPVPPPPASAGTRNWCFRSLSLSTITNGKSPHCSSQPSGRVSYAAALDNNATLTSLYLADNNINTEGARSLAVARGGPRQQFDAYEPEPLEQQHRR